MRLKLHLLLLIVLMTCCGSMKSTSVPEDHARSDDALLWKISGKGLPSNSYLYGIIHLICTLDFSMSKK